MLSRSRAGRAGTGGGRRREGGRPDGLRRRVGRHPGGSERRPPRRPPRRQRGSTSPRGGPSPDEPDDIEEALRELSAAADLVVTTGGTGFAPRDVTPEATARVVDRATPGLDEHMRAVSIAASPHGMLSRGSKRHRGLRADRQLPRQPAGLRRALRRRRARARPRPPAPARPPDGALTATPVYARRLRLARQARAHRLRPALRLRRGGSRRGRGARRPALAWITVAMVGARSLAMALNRLIDAGIDARNPRTARRELPAGLLTPVAGGGVRRRVARRLPGRRLAAPADHARPVADPGRRVRHLPVPEAVHAGCAIRSWERSTGSHRWAAGSR